MLPTEGCEDTLCLVNFFGCLCVACTKLKLYNTCNLPIFLYGSGCWAVTKRDVHKIYTLDNGVCNSC